MKTSYQRWVTKISWFSREPQTSASSAMLSEAIEIRPALSCLFKKTVHLYESSCSDKTSHGIQSNTVKYTPWNTLILCFTAETFSQLLRFSAVWLFYHFFHLCCQSFALLALKLIWFHFFLQQIFVYRGSNIHRPSIIQLLAPPEGSWAVLMSDGMFRVWAEYQDPDSPASFHQQTLWWTLIHDNETETK